MGWGYTEIQITTHDRGGITYKDFELAQRSTICRSLKQPAVESEIVCKVDRRCQILSGHIIERLRDLGDAVKA